MSPQHLASDDPRLAETALDAHVQMGISSICICPAALMGLAERLCTYSTHDSSSGLCISQSELFGLPGRCAMWPMFEAAWLFHGSRGAEICTCWRAFALSKPLPEHCIAEQISMLQVHAVLPAHVSQESASCSWLMGRPSNGPCVDSQSAGRAEHGVISAARRHDLLPLCISRSKELAVYHKL